MSFFNFRSDLPHQLAAISSVTELFDGLGKRDLHTGLRAQAQDDITSNAEEWDDLADDLIEENLLRIQSAHNAEQPDAPLALGRLQRDDGVMLEGVSVHAHSCPHFTIEMETGTGKTYVYLRSMLELHHLYGFTKFIVVVPSVAILEGVKKTFEDTRSHFLGIFGTTNFSLLIYDGSKPHVVTKFTRDVFPSLLVMTQQAFNSSSRNIYKSNDKIISDLKPYEWIQKTRPIIILDEPQNMGSEKSKEAIRTLRPLFVLRYSATHRKDDQPNPVYRLTPVQAFRLGLVKRVEVTGIAELGIEDKSTLRLLEVTRNPIRAKVRALCLERNSETREKEIVFKSGDDIFAKTKLPEHQGLKVANIRAASEGISASIEIEGGLEGGKTLSTEDELQGSAEQAWRLQIEETIRSHFAKQRKMRKHGVKVLSLFFIDRVANYVGENPRIRKVFDECFNALKQHEPEFKDFDAGEVREAYFAKTVKKKNGTEEDAFLDDVKDDSKEAKEAFELIMRRKETLLSFPTKKKPGSEVAFIFAHSALREGWDNPNVFQICTLNQTGSVMKKRQEIGRGLRLCVNQVGERITDPVLNVLTVVANESYESYVRTLQTEYLEAGDQAPPPPSRPGKLVARRREELAQNVLFQSFWKKLCQRLEYTIDVDTDALIQEAVERINNQDLTKFPRPMLAVTRGRFLAIEYSIEFVRMLDAIRAQIRLRTRSSESDEVHKGYVPPTEVFLNIEADTDLARETENPHLRGYKVLEIGRHFGEMRVRFANEVSITESEVHRFSGIQIDKNPAQEVAPADIKHAIPDFINRAAEETFLTRQTLQRIFADVSSEQKSTLHKHPEGWANTFVRVVSDTVRDHIVDRLRFRDLGSRDTGIEIVDDFFLAEVDHAQRELIDGGVKSLYDKVQIDSDVERDFVDKHLRPDEENLVVYFKFPNKFRIDLPTIIGDYNPDWGILRCEKDSQFSLELIRETKGGDDLEKLRFLNEGRKLILAERYFEALGIDYRFVGPEVKCYWESRHQAMKRKKVTVSDVSRHRSIPLYDLQAAAGAFSKGQSPNQIDVVELEARKARRAGLFAATISGESMNRVAPNGSLCLWQHLGVEGVPAPSPGEYLLVRREGLSDPDLGEFTFKRWDKRQGEARLSPVSTLSEFQPLEISPSDSDAVKFIARFVEVLRLS